MYNFLFLNMWTMGHVREAGIARSAFLKGALTLAGLVLAAALLMSSVSAEVIDPGPLPIVAYCAPPHGYTTTDTYRDMVEAGFTHSVVAAPAFPDYEAIDRVLSVADEVGMKVFINLPSIETEPEAVADRYQDHPALAGYFVRDEPSARDFPALKSTVERLQSVDATHPCYINLFPNYASQKQLGTTTYREHVDRFVAEVPVPLLSFDHYPVQDYQVRAGWYENLEIISQKARDKHIPFWAFALVSTHWSYYPATLAQLRLQMYSNLAYGAQGLQYFPYWAPNAAHTHTCVDPEGNRGGMYDRVKQLNIELHHLSGVFHGAQVLSVGHTLGNPSDVLPSMTSPHVPTSPVMRIETKGRTGAIVSRLVNQSRYYVVIVNRDYAHVLMCSVDLDGTEAVGRVLKDGSIEPVTDRITEREIDPGDILILSWIDGESSARDVSVSQRPGE